MTLTPTDLNMSQEVTPRTAVLQEIFSSIQGEGPYVGKRQAFIRFNVCHLSCQYCDSPAQDHTTPCQIYPLNPMQAARSVSNPLNIETVLEAIETYAEQTPHHSASLTGGEPLLYVPFLKELLPRLAEIMPVYLETSANQPKQFEAIMDWITYVAMDIKLPSATGEPMPFEGHKAFYDLVTQQQKKLFIKLVFSETTHAEELVAVCDIVQDKRLPIILQPVTSLETRNVSVSLNKILSLESQLSQWFSDVRVIPQTHKMLGLL